MFSDLLCQLDTVDCYRCRGEALEPQHGPDSLFDPAVILLNHVVQILIGPYPRGFHFRHRPMRSRVCIQRDHSRAASHGASSLCLKSVGRARISLNHSVTLEFSRLCGAPTSDARKLPRSIDLRTFAAPGISPIPGRAYKVLPFPSMVPELHPRPRNWRRTRSDCRQTPIWQESKSTFSYANVAGTK
jgi:hypothetical protein